MSGQDDLKCGLIPFKTNTFSLNNGSYFCLNLENHQFDKGFHKFLPTHVPVERLRYGGACVYLVVLYCLRGVFCSITYCCKACEPALLEQHACKERQHVHMMFGTRRMHPKESRPPQLCSLQTILSACGYMVSAVFLKYDNVFSFLCQTSASCPMICRQNGNTPL